MDYQALDLRESFDLIFPPNPYSKYKIIYGSMGLYGGWKFQYS